jgi:hypothetical protein
MRLVLYIYSFCHWLSTGGICITLPLPICGFHAVFALLHERNTKCVGSVLMLVRLTALLSPNFFDDFDKVLILNFVQTIPHETLIELY